MNFVILDLEWNGTYSRRLKGFINEIIEFGAVKTDKDLNIIDTFSSFVRPQVGKHISGKIKTLTNITNEELSTGLQFMQVTSQFKKWIGDAVVMTWGTSDVLALIENCRYFCGNEHISFLKKYVNLQNYCEQCLHYDATKQMGLSTAAQLLSIGEEDIDHHRALDDSLLSLRCLKELYDKSSFMPFIQNAETKEFYDKIMFKTVIVCDLSNPLVKRSDMIFHCDICGRRAHRQGEWQLKNKSYRAEFTCKRCQHRFYGRVQFKLKYDGLVVKKCILPYKEEPSEDEKAADVPEKLSSPENITAQP